MRIKHMVLGVTLGSMIGAPALLASAQAQEGIYVPLFSYRTGPFAGSGIHIANGMSDYLNLLNERDGGIGGEAAGVDHAELDRSFEGRRSGVVAVDTPPPLPEPDGQ